jgi:hypothetical protein
MHFIVYNVLHSCFHQHCSALVVIYIYIELIDIWKMEHREKQRFVRIKMDTFQIRALI